MCGVILWFMKFQLKMFGFKNSLVQAVIFFCVILNNYMLESVFLKYTLVFSLCVSVVLSVLMFEYDYWMNRGVFSPPALPIVGHIWPIVAGKEQAGVLFQRIYESYKDKKILGIHQFYRRTLVICDPELVRRVCVNDFAHFTARGFFIDKEVDPLAESVLYLSGNEWKTLRAKISPMFSPIKLKGMLPLIEKTANEFVKRVKTLVKEAKDTSEEAKAEHNNNDKDFTVVDSEELVGGYTADAIVPCAFGVKSHVMHNADDPVAVALGAFYEMSFSNILEKTMRHLWPALVLFMKMRTVPKKTHDFFYNVVSNVIKERQNGFQEKRGDFIDMMMALQSEDKNVTNNENDVKITDMIIAANAFLILLGGYETTSTTLAFLFLELAAHPELQEKMREEIREVTEKHGGRVSLEALQDLTYMDMVIQETLRLYPPFPNIQRMCTRDYTIPGSSVVVEKGTLVVFPTMGFHRDELYFEKSSSFIPERWRPTNAAPPPGVYAPFGDGPRYCIGKRFAVIQMKTCLVKLLPHIRISPAPSTEPRTRPFEVDSRLHVTLHPANSRVKISLL